MAMPAGRQSLDTLDVQPVSADSLLVLVTGRIILEGQENPLQFGQAFLLTAAAGGTPSVASEFFRFNYGETCWVCQAAHADSKTFEECRTTLICRVTFALVFM
jgi:hypothetical protein